MRVPVRSLDSGLTSSSVPLNELIALGDYVQEVIFQHLEVGDFKVAELADILMAIDNLAIRHLKYYPEQELLFRD